MLYSALVSKMQYHVLAEATIPRDSAEFMNEYTRPDSDTNPSPLDKGTFRKQMSDADVCEYPTEPLEVVTTIMSDQSFPHGHRPRLPASRRLGPSPFGSSAAAFLAKLDSGCSGARDARALARGVGPDCETVQKRIAH